MNYRQAELLATTNFTSSGTKTVDINVSDLISRIIIVTEAENNDYDPDGHPADFLTGIEVVDGSEVIFSMDGRAAQALHYYSNGLIDHNELNAENHGILRAAFTLDFGRHIYDELYALDPSKFKNLQLRISHDYSNAGCGLSSLNLRVLADMFDEKVVSPVGFLLSKEIFSFSPADGAAEYVELPVDEVIRKLMIINTSDSECPDVQFERIKLDEEDGKRVIIDALCKDVIRMYEHLYPRFFELLASRGTSSGTDFYITPLFDVQMSFESTQAAATDFYCPWSGGRVQAVTTAADCLFQALVSGHCPHGAVPLLFGKQAVPEDWWDVSRVNKARLKLTPRANDTLGGCDTTEPTHVIVQQAKRY